MRRQRGGVKQTVTERDATAVGIEFRALKRAVTLRVSPAMASSAYIQWYQRAHAIMLRLDPPGTLARELESQRPADPTRVQDIRTAILLHEGLLERLGMR